VGNLRGSLPPPTGVATSYDVVLFGSFFEKRYPLAAGSRTTSYIQADHVDRPALTTCSSNALGWGTCSYFTWDIAASLAAVSVFTITGRWHQEMRRESYTETRQHRSFFFSNSRNGDTPREHTRLRRLSTFPGSEHTQTHTPLSFYLVLLHVVYKNRGRRFGETWNVYNLRGWHALVSLKVRALKATTCRRDT